MDNVGVIAKQKGRDFYDFIDKNSTEFGSVFSEFDQVFVQDS